MLLAQYNPRWTIDFECIRLALQAELADIMHTIEHVGSTAVPHLDAKPIIDIDIIYFQPGDFNRIQSALDKTGYYHNGNQGIPDREVFKRNGAIHHDVLDTIPHHLYVCSSKSKALERHILSRNFLRRHEWARLQYQQMKYTLAAEANQDRKRYADLKEQRVNAFIDIMVAPEKPDSD